MNENNNLPENPAESVETAAIPQETALSEPKKPASPKKKFPMWILAVVVCVGGIAGTLYAFSQTPETVVYTSLANTGNLLMERDAKLDETIPARAASLAFTKGSPSKTTFSLEANDFMDSTGTLDGSLLKAVFGGLAMEGVYSLSPSAKIARLDAGVSFYDKKMLDAEVEISKEQASLALPGITDGALSISPATFAQDYKNGPFMETQPVDDETLQLTQQIYSSYVDGLFASQKIDVKQIRQDVLDIAMGVVGDAAFQKAGTSDGNNVYTVELQGAKVRQTVLDMMRYWYIDSAFGKAYSTVASSPYYDYATLVEDYIIAPLAESLTDMPTTVTLHIDSQKVIRRADVAVSFSPDPVTGRTPSMTSANGTFGLDDSLQATVMFQAENQDEFLGSTITTVAFQEKITDTAYGMDVTFWTESAIARIQAAGSIMMDAGGMYDAIVNVTAGEGESQLDMNVTYNSNVALTEAGSVWDVTNLSGAMQTPQDFMLASFSGKFAFEPVTATDVALRQDVTPILSMSYDQFLQEANRLLFVLQNAIASVTGG